ncbi:MAG: hypothetical protein SGJ24_10445 [Chloroflexota bacterium]|nr:hypothetical protein [Chloroflexota bacterium]
MLDNQESIGPALRQGMALDLKRDALVMLTADWRETSIVSQFFHQSFV